MNAQTREVAFLAVFFLVAAASTAQAEDLRATPALAPSSGPATSAPAESARPAESTEEEAVPAAASEERPDSPTFIRLNLLDGSVISGDLTVKEITVDTEFGKLTVPIAKVRSFTPGLDSYPDLSQKIAGLIEALGADDYKGREQAHKDLLKMGQAVRREVEAHRDDSNAERKRHVLQILKELDELADESESFEGSPAAKSWIRQDTIVTTDFTIVGRIAPTEFTVNSKYGPLRVALADVRLAERAAAGKEAVVKSLSVEGTYLAQRSMKSSGMRVERGDRVTISAEGQITMTPWGGNYTSTPDGGAYYGWFIPNEIYGGALVAKIGSNDKMIKIGSRATFVAQTSGVLQFGIGMQAQYANEGYNYPGQYNLKIKVEPQ
jgi:hypothetical protein